MVKAIDRTSVVTDLRLEAKSGGRSGDFRRDRDEPSDPSERSGR
jgi:cyclic pyranopterin phosphate synthase